MTTTTLRPALTADEAAAREAQLYGRHEAAVRAQVVELNELLGLADADHKASFGYIGNCDFNGANDYRRWYVFLPHPGRVGEENDRLGGFSTGSAEGVFALRKSLTALMTGVRLARGI
jgi:hypothetical protein